MLTDVQSIRSRELLEGSLCIRSFGLNIPPGVLSLNY